MNSNAMGVAVTINRENSFNCTHICNNAGPGLDTL